MDLGFEPTKIRSKEWVTNNTVLSKDLSNQGKTKIE